MELKVSPGDKVLVRTAFDQWVERRATTEVLDGDSFAIVRVCSDEDWDLGAAGGPEPRGSAWPAKDVRLIESAQAISAT